MYDKLPTEIIGEIVSWLDPKMLYKLLRKGFKQVLHNFIIVNRAIFLIDIFGTVDVMECSKRCSLVFSDKRMIVYDTLTGRSMILYRNTGQEENILQLRLIEPDISVKIDAVAGRCYRINMCTAEFNSRIYCLYGYKLKSINYELIVMQSAMGMQSAINTHCIMFSCIVNKNTSIMAINQYLFR